MQDISILKAALAKPVALVGMMGSGKSEVGDNLAGRLALACLHTDAEVERVAGQSISSIFETRGEAAFRAMERDAIRAAIDSGPGVISTGGGAMSANAGDSGSAELLLGNAIVVWLMASPGTLLARIGNVSGRPLLAGGDALATLQRILGARQADYGRAHIAIDTERLGVDGVADQVANALGDHLGLAPAA